MTHFVDNISSFISKFKKWYKSKDIKQGKLAEQLGISRSHLNKVLNYRVTPSVKLLDAMVELMEKN